MKARHVDGEIVEVLGLHIEQDHGQTFVVIRYPGRGMYVDLVHPSTITPIDKAAVPITRWW